MLNMEKEEQGPGIENGSEWPVQPRKVVHLERQTDFFPKHFRLDRTNPFRFRPKFPDIWLNS